MSLDTSFTFFSVPTVSLLVILNNFYDFKQITGYNFSYPSNAVAVVFGVHLSGYGD
jgi:hypothetical protein